MDDTALNPPVRIRPTRPGWPEIAAGAATFAALMVGLALLVSLLAGDPVARGLVLGAASGLLGLAAFYVAFAIRIRRHAPFGVGRISPRWLLIGVAWGVGAFLVVRIVIILLAVAGVDLTAIDPQDDYRTAASGGAYALVLSILMLGVLTPIGEEFAFRGILTNALRRYGAWVSVIVSTAVFALAHGVNLALVPATVVGVIAAILFLRSGSVWPGVVVHAVNNTLGVAVGVLFASA